jgi:hypothetical protein
MDKLNRYGRMRLKYLRTCRPEVLETIRRSGALLNHLLTSQRRIAWDLDQMVFAGVEEGAAERYVIQEHIRNPELI